LPSMSNLKTSPRPPPQRKRPPPKVIEDTTSAIALQSQPKLYPNFEDDVPQVTLQEQFPPQNFISKRSHAADPINATFATSNSTSSYPATTTSSSSSYPELNNNENKSTPITSNKTNAQEITPENINDAIEIASQLRAACSHKDVDPGYLGNLVDLCEARHKEVLNLLNSETIQHDIDLTSLIGLNETLLNVLQLAKKHQETFEDNSFPPPVKLPPNHHHHHHHHHLVEIEDDLPKEPQKEPCSKTSSCTALTLRAPKYGKEVKTHVEKKDVFSLICMLRGHNDKRFQAAWALMRFAKQEATTTEGVEGNTTTLRDEIKSSGGMHSLLTLFKTSGKNTDLKLVTALAVAYLLPSFTDPIGLSASVGLKVTECLRYLIKSRIKENGDICRQEIRETAALALTHLWINALQPKFTTMTDAANNTNNTTTTTNHTTINKTYKHRQSSVTFSNYSSCGISHGNRGRRLEQRQDMQEIQELLETTVSLIVTIAESEIEDGNAHCTNSNNNNGQNNNLDRRGSNDGKLKADTTTTTTTTTTDGSCQESDQGLVYNAAVTVESMCAVECARPVAVREGLLKVLVRWLSSGNVELVRPAANALRDLTSPQDEYMAGWIHSQIVNEDALPAIIELSASTQSDVRLAVAQILSSLSVAPHTRAAIVEAKGLSYLVQLLVDTNLVDSEASHCEWDEPLALAAGNALLQLAAGAMAHASGWGKSSMSDSVAPDKRDNVINDIVQGGAIEPLVAMAQTEERGKLRLMSVEALKVISEDVRPGRFTREKLCDAGAGTAFGKVLKHDISSLYGLFQSAQSALTSHASSSKSAPGDEDFSDEDALQELYHALHALANILEPITEEEMLTSTLAAEYGYCERDSRDSLVNVCLQTAENGGVESLLWLTSLPTSKSQLRHLGNRNHIDPNELLMDSCRSLASLCPLLISDKAASRGFAKWAGDVLLALTGVLKRKVNPDDEEEYELVRELQLEALRGLCSLAEYEPLKIRIIDESLPQLLRLKNSRDDIAELAHSANQVCIALGFTEDEFDIQLAGNDPKPMADWFSFERSMLLQAMARDEIRTALSRTWTDPLQEVAHLLFTDTGHPSSPEVEQRAEHSNSSDDSRDNEDDVLLRRLFKNLGDDSDSAGFRNTVIEQYANIYEEASKPSKLARLTSDSYFTTSFSKLEAAPRRSLSNPDQRFQMETSHDSRNQKSTVPAGVQVAFPHFVSYSNERTGSQDMAMSNLGVEVIDQQVASTNASGISNDSENMGLLSQYPYPINGTLIEKEWILSYRRELLLAQAGYAKPSATNSVMLPSRVKRLLDFYIPSKLFQNECLPLCDLQPESSFNFRALAMPERRYFSFRREGQVLMRVCEKHAGAINSEDVHWVLGFTNSTFAGEFAETLVQALYRCPIIQAMSFSRNNRQKMPGTILSADEEEDDGSVLLANLAGSLPPWVTHLTFDNILSKRALDSIVAILKSMGELSAGCGGTHGIDHDRDLSSTLSARRRYSQPPPAGHTQGTFHGLAIRNHSRLSGDTFKPFFNLLGFGSSPDSLQYTPLITLKILDLSGNRLGDEIVATVLQIAHRKESRCSLEQLDLSKNDIGTGDQVVKVLKNYVTKYRKRSSSWCSPLHTLNLSLNDLGIGNAALEIIAMLKNDALCLKSLDVSANGLTDGDGFLNVISSIGNNKRLVELNLSKNMFSTFFIDGLLNVISAGGSGTSQGLSFLHLNGNIPPLTKTQEESLSHILHTARKEQLKVHFQESKKPATVDEKEKISLGAAPTIEEESEYDNSSSNLFSGEKIAKTNDNDDALYPSFSQDSNNMGIGVELRPFGPHRSNSDGRLLTQHRRSALDNAIAPVDYSTEIALRKEKNRTPSKGNMITVLFSAPLVWRDQNNSYQPIEMLDFELERELLWQCFKEASMDIELSFDNATTDRLQATMTKCCGCLHFSGHGHPNYLTFEDFSGGLHWLGVDNLKNLISSGVKGGGAPFKFVFVSACHSGLAGRTFVSAGVPHVVCCHQESELMDSAALAFTRAFYLALAVGRTVKDSFEIGKQAVNVSPTVPNSEEEMKKFVLLPEDGNHDVPVFDAEPVCEWPRKSGAVGFSRRNLYQRSSGDGASLQDLSLPTPPQGFLGREIDMYHVLNAVLTKRFVSLVGPTGIGRGSLASALCHYISDRKSTMITIETIYYVRARQKRGNDGMASVINPFYKQLVAAGKAKNLPKGADMDDVFQSIFKALSKVKALVVFDRVEVLDGTEEAQEFPLFLSTLFRETRNVRVLMTACKPLGLSTLGGVGEHTLRLGPLNLKSTVRLFAILCPQVHTGEERRRLLELLVTDDTQARLCHDDEGITKRTRKILMFMGNGVPSRTFNAAYQTSKKEYEDFLNHVN